MNKHKAIKKSKQNDQRNSFPCRVCKVIYTEESGASPNFVCEGCLAKRDSV
jgi:hypothetical protein